MTADEDALRAVLLPLLSPAGEMPWPAWLYGHEASRTTTDVVTVTCYLLWCRGVCDRLRLVVYRRRQRHPHRPARVDTAARVPDYAFAQGEGVAPAIVTVAVWHFVVKSSPWTYLPREPRTNLACGVSCVP